MVNLRSLIHPVAVALLALAGVDAHAAHFAAERTPYTEIRPVIFQTSAVSLDQAIAIVQAKYGARVMRANTVEEDGRAVHYIRLMSPDRSRVWTVRVDAATGREF